ncbi:MAG: hypothetical protein ACR2PH_08125 [Desulfobulbia bacterium]
MSKSKKEYFDVCESDDWQAEQAADPDYPVIIADYHEKSFEQFIKDLQDPGSQLIKDLGRFIDNAKAK